MYYYYYYEEAPDRILAHKTGLFIYFFLSGGKKPECNLYIGVNLIIIQ